MLRDAKGGLAGRCYAAPLIVCFAPPFWRPPPSAADRRRQHWAERRPAARVAAAGALQTESGEGCRAHRELYVPRDYRTLGARARREFLSVSGESAPGGHHRRRER